MNAYPNTFFSPYPSSFVRAKRPPFSRAVNSKEDCKSSSLAGAQAVYPTSPYLASLPISTRSHAHRVKRPGESPSLLSTFAQNSRRDGRRENETVDGHQRAVLRQGSCDASMRNHRAAQLGGERRHPGEARLM